MIPIFFLSNKKYIVYNNFSLQFSSYFYFKVTLINCFLYESLDIKNNMIFLKIFVNTRNKKIVLKLNYYTI